MSFESGKSLWGHSSVLKRQINDHSVGPLQQKQPSVSMLQRAPHSTKCCSLILEILTLERKKPRTRRQSLGCKTAGFPGRGSFIMLLHPHHRFQTIGENSDSKNIWWEWTEKNININIVYAMVWNMETWTMHPQIHRRKGPSCRVIGTSVH